MKIRIGKIGVWLLATIAVLLLAIYFGISPVAKRIIEKNSEKWTGRKITMTDLHINLFNLDLAVGGLTVYEAKSDRPFFSAERLHTNLSLSGLIKGEYDLEPVEVVGPQLVVEQTNGHFNFDDLVERFTAVDSTEVKKDTVAEALVYRVKTITVTNGLITYRDKSMGQEIVVQGLNVSCPQFTSESSLLNAGTDFSLKSGGHVEASIAMDLDKLTYNLKTKIDSLDLQLFNPYLDDYLKTSWFGGLLSSRLAIAGNFNTPEAVALKGDIALADFRIDDEAKQTVAAWKNLQVNIDSLNVASNIYSLGEVSLDDPYLLVEMYDKSNNFTRMMPSDGAATDTASVDEIDYSNPFTIITGYIKTISRDYIVSDYTASNIVIRNGHVVYNDYTLEDKFTYDLEELNLLSGPIDSKSDSVSFDVSCLTNRSGILNAHLAFDPRDYQNMSVNYTIQNMRISDFNPYSKFYVAHAFVEGMLFYSSTNRIHDGMLASTNKIDIQKIEVSRRIAGKGLYSLPLRLAISLLRDGHGNILLDIPVKGDLKDPKYKLGKVIWQVLKNIVVKAATAPFKLFAKIFGANEEELQYIRFDYLQDIFDKRQMKSLDLIEKSLAEKPDINVGLVQVASRESEKELMAMLEAKKRFYLDSVLHTQKDTLTADDLKAIGAITNRDSLFTHWLNQKMLPDDLSQLPNEAKSRKLLGEAWLSQQTDSLFARRNRMVRDYLIVEKKIDPARIKISNTTDEKSAQFESTPRYKVNFFVDEDEQIPEEE